jgi:radical SAM protein with 4Fe4S-binding SPASM domain
MCDIWRIRQVREITAADLEPHMASLRELKVRWVVFSGGEPLLHSDLASLARLFRAEGIRTTLLTAGLTLERHAPMVAEGFDEVMVSLDGPRDVHNGIRGVADAYGRLERGISALREHRAFLPVHARCTVQKNNHTHLRAAVDAAHELRLDSLSFLAADTTSEAFNHLAPGPDTSQPVTLTADEVNTLSSEMESLIRDCFRDIRSGFIRESPEKLRRIVRHFRSQLDEARAIAPRCNAPWVSAVIEADGAVRPCFFHKPFGRIQQGALLDVLNSDAAVEFRSQLDVARNPICRACVCSLYWKGEA